MVFLLAFTPGVAAGAEQREPGRTTSRTVVSNGTEYRYLLHKPKSYTRGRETPLMVSVHGCQTTATQHMRSTLFNEVAERNGFVVLYPDVDAIGRALPGPLNQCWKFPYPPAWVRGGSDAAAIAEMARSVISELDIDPERVYIVGTSAGGLMASIEAAAYPDLFAAVGLVESAGYVDAACFTTGIGIPAALSARLAFQQMGPRARVVPTFVIGSDGDLAFPASCADKAIEQGLRTNNLVLGGSQEAPLALTPSAVRERKKRDGYAYTVSTYRDPAGCRIGERWIIHGMPHGWPGGSTDPKYDDGFNFSRAPDGAVGTWRFMKRYRKSDTGMPCAETRRPRKR